MKRRVFLPILLAGLANLSVLAQDYTREPAADSGRTEAHGVRSLDLHDQNSVVMAQADMTNEPAQSSAYKINSSA